MRITLVDLAFAVDVDFMIVLSSYPSSLFVAFVKPTLPLKPLGANQVDSIGVVRNAPLRVGGSAPVQVRL